MLTTALLELLRLGFRFGPELPGSQGKGKQSILQLSQSKRS